MPAVGSATIWAIPISLPALLTFDFCRPYEAASLLDQEFSVRFFVEGALIPSDPALNVYVWPGLAWTDVPLRIKSTGSSIGYEGTLLYEAVSHGREPSGTTFGLFPRHQWRTDGHCGESFPQSDFTRLQYRWW